MKNTGGLRWIINRRADLERQITANQPVNLAYRSGFLVALGGLLLCESAVSIRAVDELSWPAITSPIRPWIWWWWPGSAVDTTNVARQLELFQQAGLGGVQVTPIYGAKGWESHYLPYLSPEWMQMMNDTAAETRRLGLGMDMTLGTGWCFGGPTVSDQDANASVVVKIVNAGGGGKLKEKFDRASTQALMAFSPAGQSVDLTRNISTDGEVDWIAPAGTWTVYAISQRPSGQKVKRAAPGGAGWMLNPLYPRAMRDWLTWFDKALADDDGGKARRTTSMKDAQLLMVRAGFSRPKPQAVFQDSYEYRTDWSPDFFAQFEKLRGYKLQTQLPALFGEAGDDHTARVKYDYRRTVSDIMAGQSEPIWIDWAHRHGFQAIYQAHGTPGNWLDLYADADIPETEMFHNDRSILISKFASSAAHVAGRPLTGAETGTWLAEHFTETLADLKYLADDMFLSGVNHIYYHGCCYSPEAAPWPGWLFYAATEMNPRNSIWHDVPALNAYIARCQSILQSGKPDNDILLYWPVADFWSNPSGRLQPMTVSQTDWFEDQPIGKTAHELWNRGYAFDYASDAQLLKAKVVKGKIRVSGGDYRVIVVPECQYMPLETFKQLFALAKKGATIIFCNELPIDVSGLNHLENQRAEFADLKSQLLFKVKTRLIRGINQSAELGLGQIECDNELWFPFGERMVYSGLSFVRRSFDGGWNYFIANRGTNNFDGWISPARPATSAVVLDPLTGNTGVAAQNVDGSIHLQLAAGGSLILRVFADRQAEGPAWAYWQTNGRPMEISGNWNVKFIQGGPTLPADCQPTKLASWTTFPDAGTREFAGSADYSLTFNAPSGGEGTCFLDLGRVCQSARVRLNGKDYGTLIVPPFRVVVDNLKPTGNQLEVEVTNVSANRIRDLDRRHVRWKYFYDINFVNINYRPFDASHWPLTDSGLLGPVTLTPVVAK
ncbi:MAG TPA: glycosyl hydrolase [Candidatus Sulfopaludibacter sp.]|nr:glycosyl hydrolase [Candidatus Sulfopaludibacter sp.]